MGENTKISWVDNSWSPWWGCSHSGSPGCDHCYARALAKRTGNDCFDLSPRRTMSEQHWRQPLKWNAAAEKAGKRISVFPSMCDVFENRVELVPELRKLWNLIEATPSLDWLLLTKRPEEVERSVPGTWLDAGLPRNIWLGVTCEDQRHAAERVTRLIKIPAAVKFVSVEPQLEHVELFDSFGTWCQRCRVLGDFAHVDCAKGMHQDVHGIDWVICGGESGPHARPFDLAWARSLRDQCDRRPLENTPYFFKQAGANPVDNGVSIKLHDRAGADPAEWPSDLRVREIPEVKAS